jgi:hypothetical protein
MRQSISVFCPQNSIFVGRKLFLYFVLKMSTKRKPNWRCKIRTRIDFDYVIVKIRRFKNWHQLLDLCIFWENKTIYEVFNWSTAVAHDLHRHFRGVLHHFFFSWVENYRGKVLPCQINIFCREWWWCNTQEGILFDLGLGYCL